MTCWKNIKAIAFDLDGTLIDSVPDLAAATRATLSDLDLPGCTEEQVRSWVGNGAQVLMSRALTHALAREVLQDELDNAMPKFMHHYQDNLQQHSQLYPCVKDILAQLTSLGFPLAIVTNKPYRFTIPLLEAFGISHHFSHILGGDSLARMKPDPMPLTHLLSHWQLMPDELLMVGDSKNDILAAKAAGITSIGLTYGYNYGEDIGLSDPDAVCEQFSEIMALVSSSLKATEQENV
ncbi:phosphoglycolate phosphatase [Shewanella psychrophila]|uniref:Phosphoglycolate phosphatase n=1 Tax=Shewanella psychrophila TaxID=225848 RepID=A0A1S6HY63_9GAMM|nr:phosphoglycolate phosphatase [Shewanella psychrophila]AQS40473.1 phosphoglycolate phosphatase [Shewanella psychrophila]